MTDSIHDDNDRTVHHQDPQTSVDMNLFDKVYTYFETEFKLVRDRLSTGELDDYKERVIVSQKISEALSLLSPYVRSEWKMRQLLRDGESLKKELLSVRDIVKKKPDAAILHIIDGE